MKALVVSSSVIRALGHRLDARPYLDMAVATPEALREQARRKARSAYWRAARAGLKRARNLTRWQAQITGHQLPQLLAST